MVKNNKSTPKIDPTDVLIIDGNNYVPFLKDGLVWYKPLEADYNAFQKWVESSTNNCHCKLIVTDGFNEFKNRCYLIFMEPSERVFVLNIGDVADDHTSGCFPDLKAFYDFIISGHSCYDINKMLSHD